MTSGIDCDVSTTTSDSDESSDIDAVALSSDSVVHFSDSVIISSGSCVNSSDSVVNTCSDNIVNTVKHVLSNRPGEAGSSPS